MADAPRDAPAHFRSIAHAGGPPLEDFLAGDTKVTIVPRFTSDLPVPLLAGTPSMSAPADTGAASRPLSLGPFDPVTPATVPLWTALRLRQVGLCAIRPPAWLTPAALKMALKDERTGAGSALSPALPADFAGIAHLLLDNCADDIEGASECRVLLEQLATVRRNKLSDGLRHVLVAGGDVPAVRLENVALAELAAVRALMAGAMEQHDAIRRAAHNETAAASHASSSASQTQTQFSQSQF